MMKKLTLIVIALAAITAAAQTDGMWKSHPKYLGSGAQNIVDNGKLVLFQSNNHLFAYDKESGETSPLDKDNGASDLYVENIYQNPDGSMTVVTYNNSNIDVVRSDGTVVNIPDIKDAIYNGKKKINDVTFFGGKLCLATQFGVVVIDGNTLQVTDTYYYKKDITSALLLNGGMVLSYDDEIYYHLGDNHDNFNQFVFSERTMSSPHFVAINNQRFFVRSNGDVNIVDLEVTDDVSFSTRVVASGQASSVQRTPTGYIAVFPTAGYYYTFDEMGDNATKVTAAKEYFSCSPAGDGTLWALGANGLHLNGSTDYHKPNGWGITANAFYSAYNPGDGKVYVCRTSDNGILNKANSTDHSTMTPSAAVTQIWRYDGEKWEDATPVGAPSDAANYWLCFEAGKENSYFYSGRTNSIVHVVNDTVVQTHTSSNSPLTFMNALAFDKDGNLWGVQSFRAESTGSKYVIALPKDKLNDAPNKANWVTPNFSGYRTASNKASTIAISKGTDIKVFSIGSFNGPVLFWDNEGDIYNMDPKKIVYSSLPDADGATVDWQFIRCLTPDSIGNIWAGTTSGFLYFNPVEAFEPDFKIHRVKIKMQGDSENDYFLDGEDVYCIAVDSQNRKWLGTATQGVYLLSADNKTVLAQFDSSNSALPSNKVFTICTKPNSNSVLFVTSEGIAEYFFEAPTDVENYDNVQAYPNPLKPDFTGYVTISGLVNNSLVKITDRKGNVVAQLQAQGSIAKWDGCDPATGKRLATGVYNVYAGKDEAKMSTNAVTQIRIIQ